MSFDLDYLRHVLTPFKSGQAFMLGFSGGMDSVVLLSAMQKLKSNKSLNLTFRAMHVNHGLQMNAEQCQEFCARFCEEREIDFFSESLNLDATKKLKSGIENVARQARYNIFESRLQTNEVLLLAHHLDDQLETLLFRLNRGSGLRGLTAIPQRREFAAGEIFRPLLKVARHELLEFAQQQKLEWFYDESNENLQLDRNFLRHEIFSIIENRWPKYRVSWQKSLQLLSESNEMLGEIAEADLEYLCAENSVRLSIEALQTLSVARQRNVICYWVKQLGLPDLGWNRLHQLVNEFVPQNPQNEGLLDANGYQIGRFQRHLYALKLPPAPTTQTWLPKINPRIAIEGSGTLIAENVISRGVAKHRIESLEVRFRRGGESYRLKGRPTKSLKKLLQEAQIEPWQRDRIPLIYGNNELLCIPGIGVSEDAAAAPNEPGIHFTWNPSKDQITES